VTGVQTCALPIWLCLDQVFYQDIDLSQVGN